jgi:hypothetical protein
VSADLILICDACCKPVPDRGYLCVRYEDIHRYRQERGAWEQAHPGHAHLVSELLTLPDPITWRAYHMRCDPWPDRDAYQIDAEQLRTWQQLARWTADLMAKNWLADSDWKSLLRELADGTGTRIAAVREMAA